ncbi:MAG: hypothetical protein NZM43_11830 [Saprospiraceae bacterium]|nr:hypothetical protein [Saprospiraceae bacterium]MDW8484999.1 hypothetical protein [Saprospiraceae bacterium]
MSKFLSLLCLTFLGCGAIVPVATYANTKTEQVEQYLGTYRYKHERPVGVVKFVFKRAVLKRNGDGKKTYEQLLISEPGFSNQNNAGRLKSIHIVRDGKTIIVEPEAVRQARKREQEAAAARAKEERGKKQNVAPPSAHKTEKLTSESEVEKRPGTKRIGRQDAENQPERKEEKSSSVRDLPLRRAIAKKEAPSAEEKQISATRITLEETNRAPVTYSAPSAADAASLLVSDPVRPRQNIPPRPGSEKKGISLPDSATVVRNLEEAKEQITNWKGRLWQTIKPAWEFVMWLFSSLIVILICFAGICRYVAKTAASESLISVYGRIIVGRWIASAHQNAAAMLLVITWIIAIVLLLDVFMWLVYLDLPIWTLLIIWFPALWVAEKITSWIVPNIPVADERP